VAGPTHYDTLRVPPSASDAEIRDAYRTMAREHHPDRQASTGSAAGAVSMPAINEAYRVLGDPARRAVYDAGLRTPRAGASGPASAGSESDMSTAPLHVRGVVHPSHVGPARIPWRGLLVVGMIGVVGVVVLAQFTEPGEVPGPDGVLRVGSCVVIEPNGDARETACTGDPAVDIVVEAFVPFDATCPNGTEPRRDRQGMGVACIGVEPTSG
jgi:molecular chaperone DnaJ